MAVPEVADPRRAPGSPTPRWARRRRAPRRSTPRSARARSRCTTASSGTTCSWPARITGAVEPGPELPHRADVRRHLRPGDGQRARRRHRGHGRHPLRHARPRGVLLRRRSRHRAHPLGDRRRDAHRRGLRVEPARARGALLPARRRTRTTSAGSSATRRRSTGPTGSSTASGATTTSRSCCRGSTRPRARRTSSAWSRRVVRQEGFGDDDVPDLLYLNFKEIDYVSHVWSMNSPEMLDAVVAQDQAMKRLVTFLEPRGGQGRVGDGAHGRPRLDARPSGERRLSRSPPARCRR